MTIILGTGGELKSSGHIWVPGKKQSILAGGTFKTVKIAHVVNYDYDDSMLIAVDTNGAVTTIASNLRSLTEKGYVGSMCELAHTTKLSNIPRMKGVCVGNNHILLVGSDGQLYQVGCTVQGKLGTPLEQNQAIRHISMSQSVTTVGSNPTGGSYFAITDKKSLYVWGSNIDGQLGLPDSEDYVTEPTHVPLNNIVLGCSMGMSHSLVLVEPGNCLYSGYMAECDEIFEPTDDFKSFYCDPLRSLSSGLDHGAGVTIEGMPVVWGRNNMGQLGIGAQDKCHKPLALELPGTAWATHCRGDTTIIIMSDGTVYGFGYNGDSKDLGVKRLTIVSSPVKVCSVKMEKVR